MDTEINQDLNSANVDFLDMRSYILDSVVRLACRFVPASVDENGKLKPEYEFFVLYSILAYQDYEKKFFNDLLKKKNG